MDQQSKSNNTLLKTESGATEIKTDTRARLAFLRGLLQEGKLGTQEEFAEALSNEGYLVSQSTVSRDLRKIGAIKMIDAENRTIYRLNEEVAVKQVAGTLNQLITQIEHNGAMIVLHTQPGSASLIARHLDETKPNGMLGTIAGDDTIFVAPKSAEAIPATIEAIRRSFSTLS